MSESLQLDQRSAELLADLVAVRLTDRLASRFLGEQPLLDAAAVARRLSRSREWVYRHAAEMGAVRLGEGERPRLGFEPRKVAEYLDACKSSRRAPNPSNPVAVRRTRSTRGGGNGQGGDLLPIRGGVPPR
jgi:hypothetical protein